MADIDATNEIVTKPPSDKAALAWLREQGKITISGAELARQWGSNERKAQRKLDDWKSVGLIKRRGKQITAVGTAVSVKPDLTVLVKSDIKSDTPTILPTEPGILPVAHIDARRAPARHGGSYVAAGVLALAAVALGGISWPSELARTQSNMRIVMLTGCEDEKYVALALEAGARGYLLKSSDREEIVQAVRAIARGDSYVTPNLAARLLRKKTDGIDDDFNDLTARKAEILALLARGMSNKEIARAFSCTERTIKHHMTGIMQKLKVRNRVQAVLKFRSRWTTSS